MAVKKCIDIIRESSVTFVTSVAIFVLRLQTLSNIAEYISAIEAPDLRE